MRSASLLPCSVPAGLPFFFRRDARHLLIMLAFALPYFFILSTWTRSAVRWMLPCIPILAVGVGLLVDRSASLRDLRWLRISVCSLVAVLTVVRGVLAPVEFYRDVRPEAAEWCRGHMPEGSRVATFGFENYLARLPETVRVDNYLTVFDMYPLDVGAFRGTIRAFEESEADFVMLSSLFWKRFSTAENRFPSGQHSSRNCWTVSEGTISSRTSIKHPLYGTFPEAESLPTLYLHVLLY